MQYVTGIAKVGGNKASLHCCLHGHIGMEEAGLALGNNGSGFLWIWWKKLTEKWHDSFMPTPFVIGSPANDVEQVGIFISEECAIQPVTLHLFYFDEDAYRGGLYLYLILC